MIEPPPRARMDGRHSVDNANGAFRFTVITRSHRLKLVFSAGP